MGPWLYGVGAVVGGLLVAAMWLVTASLGKMTRSFHGPLHSKGALTPALEVLEHLVQYNAVEDRWEPKEHLREIYERLIVTRLDFGAAFQALPTSEIPRPPPRSSIIRSFKIGLLAATLQLLIMAVIHISAFALGYEFEPHQDIYLGQTIDLEPTPFNLAHDFLDAVLLIPAQEEVIFRGVIMGGLSWLGSKVNKGSFLTFWVPAFVNSFLFAIIHGMNVISDPVLFIDFMIRGMLFSSIYHKQGLMASIAMHGFSNLPITLLFLNEFLPGGGRAFSALLLFWIIAFFKFANDLFEDFLENINSTRGKRVLPYALSHKSAFVLAALMIAGAVPWMALNWIEVLFFLGAAAALLIYGVGKALFRPSGTSEKEALQTSAGVPSKGFSKKKLMGILAMIGILWFARAALSPRQPVEQGPVLPAAAAQFEEAPQELMMYLIRDLDSPDWRARYEAVESLAELGPKARSAIPSLIRVLKQDENRDVRARSARALEEIGVDNNEDVISALADALEDADAEVRDAARAVLRNHGVPL